MKSLAKRSVAALLALLARLIVRKYRPQIIMVTGSVGKTSTKDAIAAALSERTYLRASEKSYNSEFGVPLTIIGAKNPWNNPLPWILVFKEALALLLLPNHYPKTLVLEVGADRPGDLLKILRIATPNAVVVTRLPEVPVHVEAYATPEAVREEEFVPAYGLAPSAPLIISCEDEYARTYAKRLLVSLTTFGFSEGSDVCITNARAWAEDGTIIGMEATLEAKGKEYPLHLRGTIGRTQLLAPAAAVALALSIGYDIDDALKGLASYAPPAGRMRVFKGKEDSVLIDDTYNASPAAVEEALTALSLIPAKRHIAILGDMLELGRYSISEHERAGTLAAKHVDIFITVGIRARAAADAARAAGMSEESVMICESSEAAAKLIPSLIRPGDVILIKGSQSVRTERITETLLADSSDIQNLVRQDREWKRR